MPSNLKEKGMTKQKISTFEITLASGTIILSFRERMLGTTDPECLPETEKPMFQFSKQTGGAYRFFVTDINEESKDDHKD